MAQHLLVGTRKGLFTVDRAGSGYEVVDAAHLGSPVTAVLHDPRDGTTYAALDHGHFGVKLHRRDPGGGWAEITCPAYPPQPDGEVEVDQFRQIPIPWATKLLWTLEAGHPDAPGRIWAGTIPGGLFVSDDRGDSWSLVRSLWDDPSRTSWSGGGYDYAGIHSVCVDPRDA
ncbi:MAG: exo-alpha-sialidase, partial [Acidimicrobiia bacterium]